jgi:molecular chaperone DnaK (HSP70)
VIFEEFSTIVRSCFPEEIHNNIRFVTEPEAAILSLQRQGHLQTMAPGKTTLIIDVGGSTTDMVAGEVDTATGELIFIGRYGEPFGGGHYDVAIGNSISDELLIPASAIANDPSALLSLRNVGKRLKESLSRQLLFDPNTRHIPQRTVTLVMRDGEIYRGIFKLDKDRFKTITKNLSAGFNNLIESGLKAIGLREENIGQVVLVGGGAQLFSIFRTLEERFEGTSLILADNPDESVVHGASLEYGAEAAKNRPTMLFIPQVDLSAGEPLIPEKKEYCLKSEEGIEFPLVPGDNRVGRLPENEIHLLGEKISRFHAKIVLSEDSITVTDLGSTNGTYVNDIRQEANQTRVIQPDDEIRFGNLSFRIKQLS